MPIQSTRSIAKFKANKGIKISAIATLMAIVASINACSITTSSQPPKPQSPIATNPSENLPSNLPSNLPLVVATNTVTCDLTRQIAGSTIALKCLIEAGTDPHLYQPKPEDRKAIDSAKLILYGGYDFEPNLIKLIKASSNNAPKVAVNELAVTNPLLAEAGDDHSKAKDVKPENRKLEKETDPHIWHNAQNGIKIAQAISKSLSNLRPEEADTYARNTAKVVNELDQIDTWIKDQIATIPPSNRKLVTTHDALGYYAKAYGIPVEGALNGISTEEQPTPTRVKELVDEIKSSQVPTIFAEVSINPKLISAVAKEANVKVAEREIYADGLGSKGSEAETYTGMLVSNTRTIVEGLGGKYKPFQLK
ncbi:metal ABC transporter solute-binding protein, Zn/Mn family [Pseudanabaena sp. UWO310]|uniref:metal ABC transporter solute-binding protein, Zn/Mn family n=1 Tax=Pseudanabaena sp. UWO310 TaxID=2480795 RepID=UPI0011603A22|nr:zinc ABC transporter substrate-binding protein [Pseudanabaena sp. UWO310]TYQ24865.1 metal ABC transporter substrate-binding protein [Pseudanabaena sp. UWO310]